MATINRVAHTTARLFTRLGSIFGSEGTSTPSLSCSAYLGYTGVRPTVSYKNELFGKLGA